MATRARPAAAPRLLLIDEIEADRSLASVVLSGAFPDCDLQQVGAGVELFAALKGEKFDLVVTELGVREASWAFVLEAIRALQPQAPIVVFSHTADRDSQLEVLNAGAAMYVVKSSQGFLDLKRAVTKLLGYPAAQPSSGDDGATDPAPPRARALERDPSTPRPGGRSTRDDDWDGRTARDDDWGGGSVRDDGWVEVRSGGDDGGAISVPPIGSGPDAYAKDVGPAQLPVPLAAFVARAQDLLSGPLRKSLAIVLGVVVASALLSFLVSSATRGEGTSASAENGSGAFGVVLGATALEPAETGETPVDAIEPESPPPSPLGQSTDAERPPFRGNMPLTLELRAKAEVWVQVSLDGRDVLNATLQPGAVHVFQARSVAGLRVGNAAGLQVFWNGTDIGSMGAEGQVRRLYFTPEKVGAGAPPNP